jgi:phosphoribosylglycinamide formyltransferase 1
MQPIVKIAVLASGSGSNLQAILDALHDDPNAPIEVALVLADRRSAYALERAKAAGVPTRVVRPRDHATREEFDTQVAAALDEHGVEFIALAGFMRIFQREFVRRYAGRIINVHPALLPSFPGAHGIRDAFEHGVKVTGVTVHFVDEGVDTGPVIAQRAVPVDPGDTLESLEAKIHAVEHALFPAAIRAVAEGRARVDGRRVRVTRPVL